MAGKVPSTASRINGSSARLSVFLSSCAYTAVAINEKKRKVMEVRMSVVSVVDCAFRLTSRETVDMGFVYFIVDEPVQGK